MNAVSRAFARARDGDAPAAASAPPKPKASKGGLELLFHTQLEGDGLVDAVRSQQGLIAAADVDGAVTFVDGADGRIRACHDVHDESPNTLAFTSNGTWLLHGSDDGNVRIVAPATGEVVHVHAVTEPAEAGKRPRCYAVDHLVALDDAAFVAAAGGLAHACRHHPSAGGSRGSGSSGGSSSGGWQLEHAHSAGSPIRALCRAPLQWSEWAYAIAYQGGARLVSKEGEAVRQLSTERVVKSLAGFGPWLAAASYREGGVELWNLATSVGDQPTRTLRGYCGTEGSSLCWQTGGRSLAVGGTKAAIFDFTGENPHHPYRKPGPAPIAGQPDLVPRICMANGGERCAWSPRGGGGAAAERLATVDKQGAVRLWQAHGAPLKKGGFGDVRQPQNMKPQFYTFVKGDAVHPAGEAVEPCALLWLRDDVVAVAYATAEIVAWRVAV